MTLQEHITNCLPLLCGERKEMKHSSYGKVVIYENSLLYYFDENHYHVVLTPSFTRLIESLFGEGTYYSLINVDNISAQTIDTSKFKFSKISNNRKLPVIIYY